MIKGLLLLNAPGSRVEHGGRLQPLRGGDRRPQREAQSGKRKLDESSGEVTHCSPESPAPMSCCCLKC